MRDKVLKSLWAACCLIVIFSSTTLDNDDYEDYVFIPSAILLATPLFTIYWVFKLIKDWFDRVRAPNNRI